MRQIINIATLLSSCKKGMKLYSPICGDVEFQELADDGSILVLNKNKKPYVFDSCGRYCIDGETSLFPSSSVRDWNLFFKKGDVLELVVEEQKEDKSKKCFCIFGNFLNDKYTIFQSLYWSNGHTFEKYRNGALGTDNWQKATDMDAQTFIEDLESFYGGKLNRETLEVEQEQPEFKGGDILIYTFDYCGMKVHCPLIFKEFTSGTSFTSYAIKDAVGKLGVDEDLCHDLMNCAKLRYANDKEKRDFLLFLDANGYHWCKENKTLKKVLVFGKYYFFEMENELSYIAKLVKAEGNNLMFEDSISWCAYHNVNGYDYEESSFEVVDKDCYNFREANDAEIYLVEKNRKSNEKQPKFKPLDYVLARNATACYDEGWILYQYSHQTKDGVHIMVGGTAFKTCIPYSGNEELLGTTKSYTDGE